MGIRFHSRAFGLAAGAALLMSTAAFAQEKVEFQLNWIAGGANAGFAVAKAEGFYDDVGLDVDVVQGNGSATTAQLVASGQAGIAYADAVAVSQLIAKGAPMKVVSTVYQSNPNEVLALTKSGIDSLEGLKGKTIGVPAGSSQTTMLPLFLDANKMTEADFELINMPPSSMVPALLTGQVDAILGSMDSYRVQLESQGAELTGWEFASNGVPTVSTSIFASEDFLEKNPELVKKFIGASLKGWSFAIDNPEKAVEDVSEVFPDTDPELVAAELGAITPLFCSGDAQYLGKAEPAHWVRTQDLLSKVGLLPEGVDPTSYYSNDYLPADAEMRACN
ncbi:ABC transporter substrate-binding protein [Acuticoccus sp. MNP-M23]|uniref:ABC transporter substrate-binding protein n=1 Tax=Acuticoccus sp. MNP-M23 TaxID=3072793 RepID=UPI00281561B9|nr:ABC transporter substrate-binding protein [Acuticoccus sp. MNP-M23]WMS40954.1 ABC transporter substrate-binding protein [Acuticoccus sp. MNP-M23]